jgi:2,4-dienoyl-CoA reductase (NADPH2)
MLLLKPIRVGTLELRNRMVMPAMHLGYSPLGRVSDQLVAFYRARAEGGVAMIVVGGCVINAEAGGPMFISLKSDKDVEPLRRLAAAIREPGAAACAQLYHGGRYVHGMFLDGKPALAPSALRSGLTKEMPREATHDDIRRTVADFAAAAGRAVQAGFDAVEIIASAGYLICQFLSPASNVRTDEYGGSLENRMRFGLEVLAAVREAVGPGKVVGVRLAGNEFVPGGGGLELSRAFAAALASGGVDYVSVTGGWHETRVPQILGEVPKGAFAYLSREIRRGLGVPVFLANRLGDPEVAEGVLRAGQADVVCLGRPLIADPQLPRKLAEGRAREINRCAACNQGCFDSVMRLKPVCCMVNPRVGKDVQAEPVAPAAARRVVVVGGGPAGMQAAVTAARRGHRVTLFEAAPALGGQLNLASRIPGKEPLADVSRNLEDALATEQGRGAVEVRLGARVGPDEIAALGPDVVVVATGSAPIAIDLPGAETSGIPVVQAWDVLSGQVAVGERVVVLGGGATGAETALFLARRGTLDAATAAFLLVHEAEPAALIRELSARGTTRVTLVELQRKIGKDIGPSTRWNVTEWLARCGVDQLTETEALRVTAEGLVVRSLENGEERLLPADTIVLAVGSRPEASLAEALRGRVPEVRVIGDAKAVRRALDATAEAHALAMTL